MDLSGDLYKILQWYFPCFTHQCAFYVLKIRMFLFLVEWMAFLVMFATMWAYESCQSKDEVDCVSVQPGVQSLLTCQWAHADQECTKDVYSMCVYRLAA